MKAEYISSVLCVTINTNSGPISGLNVSVSVCVCARACVEVWPNELRICSFCAIISLPLHSKCENSQRFLNIYCISLQSAESKCKRILCAQNNNIFMRSITTDSYANRRTHTFNSLFFFVLDINEKQTAFLLFSLHTRICFRIFCCVRFKHYCYAYKYLLLRIIDTSTPLLSFLRARTMFAIAVPHSSLNMYTFDWPIKLSPVEWSKQKNMKECERDKRLAFICVASTPTRTIGTMGQYGIPFFRRKK